MRRRRGAPDATPPVLARSLAVNDVASVDDHLGFARFAVPLAEYIAGMHPGQTPWTVGVYGEWGSGKTSFLKQVSAALTERGVDPVWFNAWKYAREQDLWQALIQTILDRVRVSGPWPRRAWVKVRIWIRSLNIRSGLLDLSHRLFVLLLRLGLVALAVVLVVGIFGPAANPAGGVLEHLPWLRQLLGEPWARGVIAAGALLAAKPESLLKLFDVRLGFDLAAFQKRRSYREQVAFLEEFSADFRDIVRIVCKDRPLVVVIDDLDRCLPEQTLQIVETMKLFLDVEGCVFLVAVDRDIIENAVSSRYRELASQEGLLRKISETYFEKIVQLPFSLPPVSAYAADNLVRAVSTDEDVHLCLPILRGSPPYNPRRIKRLVQTFTLLKSLAAGAWQDVVPVPALLAKIVVIQARYREVYEAVVDEPELLAALERAYRTPAGGTAAAGAEPRQVLDDERARLFEARYPDLPPLFRHEIGAADSFAAVSTVEYLSFVRAVVPAETAAEEPAAVPAFAIWHLRDDIAWAEWIARQLSGAGYPVRLAGPDQPASGIETDYLVVVLSRLAAEATPAQQWAAIRAAGALVLVARVGPLAVPPLLAGQRILGFESLEAIEARAVLLSALDPRHRRPSDLGADSAEQAGPALGYPGRGLRVTNVRQPSAGVVERPGLDAALERQVLENRREDVPAVCVLVGMPGSGKTESARAYARRHADEYRIVWWIDGTTAERAEAGLRDLAAELGGARRPDADTLALLTERLAGQARWLLIIDDAAHPDMVRRYLPLAGRGDVVITSRLRSWSRAAPHIDVPPFGRAEAAAFLAGRLPGEPAADLAGLAEALGSLPSALEAAVDYLRFASVPVAEFRARTAADERWFLDRSGLGSVLAPEPETVGALAFVASRPLPRALAGASEETLGSLHERCLVTLDAEAVEMHPLVQLAARSLCTAERSREIVAGALAAVAEGSAAFGTDPDAGTVTDHLRALTHHGDRLGITGAALQDALLAVARRLVVLGNYVHAGRVARLAAEQAGTPAGRRAAQAILGEVLVEVGRAADAVPLLRPAGKPDLLVRAYIQMDDIEAARTQQNRPGTRTDLAGMMNVAGINRAGSPRLARQVLAPMLEQHRASRPDDALVGRALSTLAGVALQMDNREEARRLYQEALAVQRRVLRPGHPDIAETLRSYAAVLSSLNERELARDSLLEAMEIWTSVVGPDDFLVTGIRRRLAEIHRELAGNDGAHIPQQDAIERRISPRSPVDSLISPGSP